MENDALFKFLPEAISERCGPIEWPVSLTLADGCRVHVLCRRSRRRLPSHRSKYEGCSRTVEPSPCVGEDCRLRFRRWRVQGWGGFVRSEITYQPRGSETTRMALRGNGPVNPFRKRPCLENVFPSLKPKTSLDSPPLFGDFEAPVR